MHMFCVQYSVGRVCVGDQGLWDTLHVGDQGLWDTLYMFCVQSSFKQLCISVQYNNPSKKCTIDFTNVAIYTLLEDPASFQAFVLS